MYKMKVTGKLFVFALILSLLFSAGAVAAEENITFDQSELQTVSSETYEENDITVSSNFKDDEALGATHVVVGTYFTNIQDKIDSADDGDTIFLNGKTYTGDVKISVNKKLTIVGGSYLEDASYATLDAGFQSRIMEITSGNVVLKGIKFINGNATQYGGALYWSGAEGVLENCIFENNIAGVHGGALGINGVNSQIISCNFTDNAAYNQGGAVILMGSAESSTISNCNFKGNTAKYWGGAIESDGANVHVRDSNFTDNVAEIQGGGAINSNSNNLNISKCKFINNTAKSYLGGAIRSSRKVAVSDSDFINNSAKTDGGAIYLTDYTGDCSIIDSNFTNNSANGNGGAVCSAGSSLLVEKNYFKDNNALKADNLWVIGTNSKILNNAIDNSALGTSGIYVGNKDNVVVLDNKFTNPNCEIQYAIMEVEGLFVGYIGSTIKIPIKVYDNFGNPMEKWVSIKGYGGRTFHDGVAVFDFQLPDDETVLDLTVSYDNVVKDIKVSVISQSVIGVSQPNGGNDDVVVRMAHGATGSVIININGINYISEIVNNTATIKLRGLYNGHYPAIVAYVGDKNYPSQCDLAIINIKHSPNYQISGNKDITVKYGGKATYKVLITKDGKAVGAGEAVTISFNGVDYHIKTDSRGYATLNLKTNIKVANYNIKTTYNGKSVLNKIKIVQIIKASDKKVKKSSKLTKVKISLNKVDGKILKNKNIKIKFNGKKYTVKTNYNGVAIWKVKKSMVKNLKTGKKVKYILTYGKDTLTKNLIIKK